MPARTWHFDAATRTNRTYENRGADLSARIVHLEAGTWHWTVWQFGRVLAVGTGRRLVDARNAANTWIRTAEEFTR